MSLKKEKMRSFFLLEAIIQIIFELLKIMKIGESPGSMFSVNVLFNYDLYSWSLRVLAIKWSYDQQHMQNV